MVLNQVVRKNLKRIMKFRKNRRDVLEEVQDFLKKITKHVFTLEKIDYLMFISEMEEHIRHLINENHREKLIYKYDVEYREKCTAKSFLIKTYITFFHTYLRRMYKASKH